MWLTDFWRWTSGAAVAVGTPGPHPLSVEFTPISRSVEFTAITRAVEFTPITRTVEFTDG